MRGWRQGVGGPGVLPWEGAVCSECGSDTRSHMKLGGWRAALRGPLVPL